MFKLSSSFTFAILLGLLLMGEIASFAQDGKAKFSYPAHLPYRFSNFPWWSKEELRTLLQKRIPGLGDEVATNTASEGRIRLALEALLKEKGVMAEVQSQEPSLSDFAPLHPLLVGKRMPPSPAPAVIFSILTPKILIDKVLLSSEPADAEAVIETETKNMEHRPYNSLLDDLTRSRLADLLVRMAYLDAHVEIGHNVPRKDDARYLVDIAVSIVAGPKYHVSSISADGGPLLTGRDLTGFFQLKPGALAGPSPFGSLGGQVRALYAQAGYADVGIEADSVLDREHATVAYHLNVIPGPLYHLRSLTIQNLDAAQESKVRQILGMKVGDVFDEDAINRVYRGIPGEPLLRGRSFSFGPNRHADENAIDLTLTFFKEGGDATVTVH
jgi:outer membrane translocation and assembly module TamA